MKSIITLPIFLTILFITILSFGFLKNETIPIQNTFSPVPIFCQSFSDTTFPPAGWTIFYTGTNYWSRVTQSGFNLGLGSAKYDLWDAPAGTNQSIVTPGFTATNNGDSLVFDIAFCPYPNAQDSLIILTSTNNGAVYNSLARLGPLNMQTTTNCSRPFIPMSPNQWARKSYVLNAGINKIAFLGQSDFGDNLYLDSICVVPGLVGIPRVGTEIPKTYKLHQNYPNPFNPETVINYDIPKESFVKIAVYDISGNEVLVLVNEQKLPGKYSISFNGAGYASGVYFYRISSGDFTKTKKMLLIK